MNPEELKKQLADNLVRELSDRGQVVEGGWRAYELMTGLTQTSAVQRWECRKAFFFGAEHVFASIVNFLENESPEPTAQDLERINKLHDELQRFLEEIRKCSSS